MKPSGMSFTTEQNSFSINKRENWWDALDNRHFALQYSSPLKLVYPLPFFQYRNEVLLDLLYVIVFKLIYVAEHKSQIYL